MDIAIAGELNPDLILIGACGKDRAHDDPQLQRQCSLLLESSEVEQALAIVLSNLERVAIPETLLADYLPAQYERLREGTLANRPHALVLDTATFGFYVKACSICES